MDRFGKCSIFGIWQQKQMTFSICCGAEWKSLCKIGIQIKERIQISSGIEAHFAEQILRLLRDYGVRQCYYGHLHGASHRRAIEGTREGTAFWLVSGDFLAFKPKKICD